MASIIFDFDGTIANTFDLTLEAANAQSEKFGFGVLSKEKLEQFMTMTPTQIFRSLGLTTISMPQMLKKGAAYMNSRSDQVEMFPEMASYIQELSQDYRLFILSGSTKKLIHTVLENHDCLHCFTDIYTTSWLWSKNTMLEKLITTYNLYPEHVLYVGDEVRDIHACKRSHVPIVSVTRGYNSKEQLEHHEPHYLVDNHGHLIKIIQDHSFN